MTARGAARGLLALSFTLTLGCGPSRQPAPAPSAWSYAELDRTLVDHVTADGLVRYDELAADAEPLARYVERMRRVSPDSHPALFPTRDHELAYWMNAYNALMLDRVVRAWPIDTVRDVKPIYGVFWMERHRLGGKKRSLRGLENEVIRERYGDPRIHFAINCASVGCPALPRRAWRGDTLDDELDAAARRFVATPANVSFDADRRVALLSSIFDWFEDDFTGWMERERIAAPHGLLDYVARYLPQDERTAWGDLGTIEVEFVPYDWAINAASD